jgi:hypothetical protein
MAQDRTEDTTDYSHRKNRDGTVDSICLSCFQTIATAKNEESLSLHELLHRCSEENIPQSERKKNSLISWPEPFQLKKLRR